jgi:hypothetical protein
MMDVCYTYTQIFIYLLIRQHELALSFISMICVRVGTTLYINRLWKWILASMSARICVNSGDVHGDMCIHVIKMIVFTDSESTRHWVVDRWARQLLNVL